MVPIYLNQTNEEISFEKLHDKLIEICEEHQKANRASAFAIIIYDFTDPHIEKILKDNIYWDSLHKISGNYLTVFSIFDTSFGSKMKEKITPRSGPMKIQFNAVSVTAEQGSKLGYIQLLNKFFNGLEFKSPSILFFQVNESVISDHFLIGLKEDKVEEGFNEIKKIIKTSVDSVCGVSKENKENYIEVFQLIQKDVESAVFWMKFKKTAPLIVEIINFVSLFK